MCLALLMIFSEGEIMTFFFTFFLFLSFWQFPFDAYDKCSMLYLSVPQKKSDIVRGRYLLAVLGIIIAFFVNTCFGLIFNPRIMRNGEILLIDSESALLWFIVVAIQAPFFFQIRVYEIQNICFIVTFPRICISSSIFNREIETCIRLRDKPIDTGNTAYHLGDNHGDFILHIPCGF